MRSSYIYSVALLSTWCTHSITHAT
ncbi:hypothetical protein F383_39064 [Gossypium arboreum]|uniref:Uncharacterized protein n=1 Tax=Gossypium arboreum TaxID=29729 RepID=A0A0B0MPM3_GOSAR|nr:hypothetical protein F383_39064 [Gossypium arboreum]